MNAATSGAAVATTCRNCGDASAGAYCPSCGQRRATKVLSLRRLLAEAVEDHLSLNSAAARTLGVLFTRPGLLTQEYLQGRIVRYVPPLRLYIVASFAFFLTLGLVRESGRAVVRTGEATQFVTIAAHEAEPEGLAEGAVVQRLPDVFLLTPALEERLAARVTRLATMQDGEMDRMLSSEFLRRAPFAMFLLVPLAAGVLKLLYLRHRRFYVEHLIFSVHLQSFIFLLFAAWLLAGALPGIPAGAIHVALTGVVAWYTVRAFRSVYGQSLRATLAKLALLAAVYLLALMFTTVATVLVTLLTMPLA